MKAAEINLQEIKKLYSIIKSIESDKNKIISEECRLSGETLRNVTNDFNEGLKQAYYYAGAIDKIDVMKDKDKLLRTALEIKSGDTAGEVYIDIPAQHRVYFGLKLIFIVLAVSAKPVIFDKYGVKGLPYGSGMIKTVKDVKVKKILTGKILTNVVSIFDDVPLSETCYSIINTIKKPDVNSYKGSVVFLQEGIKNKFLKFLEGRLAKIKISEPADKNSDISSKPDADTLSSYKKFISLAEKEKCKITGLDKKQIMKPVIIENILPDSDLLNAEYNLPSLRIVSFRTPSEFLGKVNKLKFPYQLNAFSSDYTLAMDMIKSANCIKGKIG
jgi:hypothetical protein